MMGEAVRLENRIKPGDARAELGLTLEKLSELSGIARRIISKGEKNGAIRLLTAHAILRALNEERERQGRVPLRIEQIRWKISGEE